MGGRDLLPRGVPNSDDCSGLPPADPGTMPAMAGAGGLLGTLLNSTQSACETPPDVSELSLSVAATVVPG